MDLLYPIDIKNTIIIISAVAPSKGNFIAIHNPKTNITNEIIKNCNKVNITSSYFFKSSCSKSGLLNTTSSFVKF